MAPTEVLMPISIVGSFGTALYFFTKTITDYVLKKKMIEKGYVNEDTQAIFKTYSSENKYSSLKWGAAGPYAGELPSSSWITWMSGLTQRFPMEY